MCPLLARWTPAVQAPLPSALPRCQLTAQRAGPTSAERGGEVPGGSVPRADDAGQGRVAFQDVARQTAVPDFVSDVESRSVEHTLQDFPRVSARVAG